MRIFVIIFIFINIINCTPVFDDISTWEYISNDKAKIGWVNIDGNYWCQSYVLMEHSINNISSVLNDRDNYPKVFDRIIESNTYGDIVHVKLDLPFPFASRDYIVKYSITNNNNIIYYDYKNTDELDIPVPDGYVRLINAEGQWKLVSDSLGTHVYYRWNGELRGDIPTWALTRAWEKQGAEVMLWLDEYLDSNE